MNMRDIDNAALAAAYRLRDAQPRADIGSILGTVAGAILPGIGGAIGNAIGGSSGGSVGSAVGSGLASQELSQQELQQIQNFIQQAYNEQGQATQNAQASDKNVVSGLNNPAMSGYAPAMMTAISGSAPGAVAPTSAATTPNFSTPGSLGASINGTSTPAAATPSTQTTAPTAAQLAAIKTADQQAIQQMGAGGSYAAYHQAIMNNLQNSGQFTPAQLQALQTGWANVLPSGMYQNKNGGNTNTFLNADSGALDTILSQYDASNPTPVSSTPATTIPLGNTTAAQKTPVGA